MGHSEHYLHFRLAPFPRVLSIRTETNVKGLATQGNIVGETLFLVMFPETGAKLTGSKQDVLLRQSLNEETFFFGKLSVTYAHCNKLE